jgi:prophage antirepressor-like protein
MDFVMENNIQIFNNPQFGEVRVTELDGEPVFCLSDICKVLDLQTTDVRQRLNDGVVSTHPIIDALGRTQQANFVNEDGLYDVILDSRKPEAKQFRKWVTSEVLPSIRKHGGYLTAQKIEEALLNPDTLIQLATNLKEERQKRLVAEKQVAALKPQAEFMAKVMDCGEKIDVGQSAKILQLPFGRNMLFQKLRESGIFFKNRNEPKQEYIERGYFELKEKWIDRENHNGFIVVKVLVTQRGLSFLSDLFKIKPAGKVMAKII